MTLSEWENAKVLANGDPVKLAQILKLENPETYFANKADVYAALVKPEDCTPLKVPTGREGGANGDWIPGLLTGGGFKEAVTEFGSNAAKNAVKLEF